jgi:hypothetical protein
VIAARAESGLQARALIFCKLRTLKQYPLESTLGTSLPGIFKVAYRNLSMGNANFCHGFHCMHWTRHGLNEMCR